MQHNVQLYIFLTSGYIYTTSRGDTRNTRGEQANQLQHIKIFLHLVIDIEMHA